MITMKYLYIALIACLVVASDAAACTSAIVSGRVTANGRPLLWKHRDTGAGDNKVERIAATDSTFEYVALFNAADRDCREAWIGYNSAGFAVMNTAVYNLKDDTVTNMDREGLVMTEALKRCRSVGDFARLLDSLPRPLGVEANFGVIDAAGDGAYFETCNYGYVKYDIADAPDGVLVRTNYAHSGRNGEGKGYTREDNAWHLLEPHIANHCVSAELFTEVLSKQFYCSRTGVDDTYSEKQVLADQDYIPRYTSTATVVVEGVVEGESPLLTTMWIGLGYPPCAELRTVWLGDGGLPDELRGVGYNGHSPLCDTVMARKARVFSPVDGGKHRVDIGKLYNSRGTGYCQQLIPRNEEAYRRGYELLEARRKKLAR